MSDSHPAWHYRRSHDQRQKEERQLHSCTNGFVKKWLLLIELTVAPPTCFYDGAHDCPVTVYWSCLSEKMEPVTARCGSACNLTSVDAARPTKASNYHNVDDRDLLVSFLPFYFSFFWDFIGMETAFNIYKSVNFSNVFVFNVFYVTYHRDHQGRKKRQLSISSWIFWSLISHFCNCSSFNWTAFTYLLILLFSFVYFTFYLN